LDGNFGVEHLGALLPFRFRLLAFAGSLFCVIYIGKISGIEKIAQNV
jgi:hypothetical protein